MTETNNPSAPPEGWENLLTGVHSFGWQTGRWGANEVPSAGNFRRLLKGLTFVDNYSSVGGTPEGRWALSLTSDSLLLALRMALGQIEIKIEELAVKGPFAEALADLAEKLNEGITHDNVHTIEGPGKSRSDFSMIQAALEKDWRPPVEMDTSSAEARVAEMLVEASEPIKKAVGEFDGEDFSRQLYAKLGVTPTVYDKAIEAARKFAAENGTTITGRIPRHEMPPLHHLPRSFSLDAVKRAITGGDTAGQAVDEDRCLKPPIGCGNPKGTFRGPRDAAEYRINGLCQACQDSGEVIFAEEDDMACEGHPGLGDLTEYCDGTCRVQCQYGGNCQPGKCPGPCGR